MLPQPLEDMSHEQLTAAAPTLNCLVSNRNGDTEPDGLSKTHQLGHCRLLPGFTAETGENSGGELPPPRRAMCCMKTSSTAKLYFTSSSILKHALLHSGFTSNCSQNHQDPLHHPRRPLARLSHNQSGMEQPQPWVRGQNHRHRIRFLAGQVKVGVFFKRKFGSYPCKSCRLLHGLRCAEHSTVSDSSVSKVLVTKDLSLIPGIHVKYPGMMACTCSLSSGQQRPEDSQVLLASQSSLILIGKLPVQ